MLKIKAFQVFGAVESMDNFSFDRTIQTIQMNKINTTLILEKYKMFSKHKGMLNILIYRMILMFVITLPSKLMFKKWNGPSIMDNMKVTRSFC
jgi:hypothetical protein